MDFSSILGGLSGSGGSGGIMGMVGNLIGGITGGDKKDAAPAAQPAAQQPSVFAQNQTTPGTVKMEIPAHLAGTVANIINANA